MEWESLQCKKRIKDSADEIKIFYDIAGKDIAQVCTSTFLNCR